MMESLFGNVVIEKVLFFILSNGKAYPSQLKDRFKMPLYSVQRAFARLEKGGILVCQPEGKTLLYQFNPRYPFLQELKAFLEKAYGFLPEELKNTYYEPIERKRPRRRGKPL